MKTKEAQVISANDLLDGDVVYLGAAGGWTRNLQEARIFTDSEVATVMLTDTKSQTGIVVDPYLVDVYIGDDRAIPIHIRERLRHSGPSILSSLQTTVLQPED